MSDSNPFGDSSDDDDDDFFSYKKKGFHKRNVETLAPSSPKRGRRAHKPASTDEALSKLERRRERATKRSLIDMAADEDEDSDVEIVAAAATNDSKPAAASVDLLDSSDDEKPSAPFHVHPYAPVAIMHRSGVAKETCDTIAQARNAMFKLQQAQAYRAEDVYVPAPAVQPIILDVDTAPSPAAAPAKPRNYGPPLHLKLRTNQVINGKRSETSTTETMTIRSMEPFQNLLERYQSKHNIDASESSVKFTLDGERIDLLQTPASYDLEDDDIVEVLVTTLVVRSSKSTTNSHSAAAAAAHLGPLLQLKMRTQEKDGSLVNDVMTIRLNEPLQQLMDKYKKEKEIAASRTVTFSFDGETMSMSRTPASYDMESEDIVEVILK